MDPASSCQSSSTPCETHETSDAPSHAQTTPNGLAPETTDSVEKAPASGLSLGTKSPATPPRSAAVDPNSAPGKVELCKRPADLPLLHQLGFQHHWIRTSSKEAGMGEAGGKIPGHGSDTPRLTHRTEIVNHQGEGHAPGAKCQPVPNEDEACVNRQLELGKQTGTWTPTNQCQTFAAGVLEKCKTKPTPDPESEHSKETIGNKI
jgi:hypothetical protein